MDRSVDTIFCYNGYNHKNANSICRLRIGQSDDITVMLFTEIPENEGTSITNRIELLITLACDTYGIDSDDKGLVVLEHYYPAGMWGNLATNRFSLVTYTGASNVAWQHIDYDTAITMLSNCGIDITDIVISQAARYAR